MTPHFHYSHPYFAWRSMQGVMFLSHFVFRIPVSDGIGFICLICGAFVVLTFASATLIAGDEVVSIKENADIPVLIQNLFIS
jgi:hypothetical protein